MQSGDAHRKTKQDQYPCFRREFGRSSRRIVCRNLPKMVFHRRLELGLCFYLDVPQNLA
jgi:hypothetical protein